MNEELRIINKLNKIKKYGSFLISDEKPTSKTIINSLIIFVSDTRKKHDSGYPYIRVFGEIDNNKLIDLGWHDHIMIECFVNIDSFDKNVFHIMSWGVPFYIKGYNMWCSSFMIRKDGELQ